MSIIKKDLYDYSSNIDGYEVCYFRNICNELIPYPVDGLEYLPIHKGNYYIAKEDIVLYTAAKGEENLCPIPYIIDTKNNKIVPKNSLYKKYKMYYGSRNQFLYKHIDINNDIDRIILPFVFRSGYNPSNYFIFLNGRLLNSIFYKIIIPELSNNLVDTKRIYFTRELKINDTLDIFYISNASFSRENSSGDLVIKPFKVKATDAVQREFKIPLPYNGYPVDEDSFLVMIHGIRLSKDRYKIIKGSDDDIAPILKLVDNEDYLIYGEDIVFIFPYYKANWECIDDLTRDNLVNYVNIRAKYDIKKDTNNIIHFEMPNNTKLNSDRLYLFEGTSMLSKEDYSILNDSDIKIHHDIIDFTEFVVVIETDSAEDLSNSSIFIKTSRLSVSEDGQLYIKIPKYYGNIDVPPNSIIAFKNGKLIPKNHYSVIDNKFIPGQNHNDLQNGDNIVIAYAIDGGNNTTMVNFKSYNIKATRHKEVQIPNDNTLIYNENNILIFNNGELLSPSNYKIVENTIKSSSIVLGDIVSVFLAYKTTNPIAHKFDSYNHTVSFIENKVSALKDAQYRFEIPYPKDADTVYDKTPFMLFIRGVFFPDSMYKIFKDKNRGDRMFLILNNNTPSYIKKDDILDFVFCSTNDHSNISKLEYHTELTDTKVNEVHIPYIYSEVLDLSERVMIFYGGSYIDSTRYSINKYNMLVTLYDIPYKGDKDRSLSIIFFYSGSSSNGAISYVPQSGYIKFDETNMDRNVNKDLMLVFVNGLLVPKTDIIDINNSLKKISKDLGSRYDLNILSCSPLVKELKPLFTNKNIRKYNVFVNQPENQIIKVLDNNRKPHLSSFTIEKDSTIFISVEPDFGYKEGKILVNNERINDYGMITVTSDITITATDAIKLETVRVKIIQSENQLIEVRHENDTYTSDFDAIPNIEYKVSVTSSRQNYIPGKIIGVSDGILKVTEPFTIKATPATIRELILEIKDKNLENQNIAVNVTDPITHETNTYNAPCKVDNVRYGSMIKFLSPTEKDSSYLPAKYIGPFILNKSYIADYSYPLDNIICSPATKKEMANITLHSGSKETLHVDIWSDYLNDTVKTYSVKSNADSITKQVLKGSYYKAYVVPSYGYIAGEVMSSTGELVGQVNDDIDFSVEDAVVLLPVMTISRDPTAPSIYSIIVSMSDGYSDCGPGAYSVRVGTMFECKVILHGEVVNVKSGVMPDSNISITLLSNAEVRITNEVAPASVEVDENE